MPESRAPEPAQLGCTCARLRQLSRRVTQRYDQRLAPTGLRVTQFSLLAAIRRSPGLTVTDLAQRMAMDRTTLIRNLKPLENAGLVSVADADAGNARVVTLSPAGESAFDKALPFWRDAQTELAERLGMPNLAALHVLLKDALGRLEAV